MSELKKDGIRAAMSEQAERDTLRSIAQRTDSQCEVTLGRETVCGNCRHLLYQNSDPNNIHWYHVGTGDVRCPTTFAQPIPRASVVAPPGDAVDIPWQVIHDRAETDIMTIAMDAKADRLSSSGLMEAIAAYAQIAYRVGCESTVAASPVTATSTTPVDGEQGRIRRHEMTSERWEELQTALGRPEGPTEAEAEEVLLHCGTSGREVVNQFIERLLNENRRLSAALFDLGIELEKDGSVSVKQKKFHAAICDLAPGYHISRFTFRCSQTSR